MAITRLPGFILDSTTSFTFANVSVTSNVTANNANLGNAATANYFIGDGSLLTGIVAPPSATAGTVTTNAQPNITSVGTLTSLVITGNITSGNATLGNLATASFFTGSGNLLSNIQGANVTGPVSFATIANAVAGANVSGTVANATYAVSAGSATTATTASTANAVAGANVSGAVNLATFATTANAVAGATVSGTVANATYAITSGTSYAVAGANVSGEVSLATFATTANAVAGANVSGTVANATYAVTSGSSTTAATVTTNAQPNITSVGTLTALTVTGNLLLSGSNVSLGAVSNLHITGGTANYVLGTDGTGNLTWVEQSGGGGTPGGADTQLQFNDATVFGGSAGLTFNKTTTTLTANNLVATSTANLGAIGNVTITGGTDGQLLATNGSGTLTWIDPASSVTSTSPTTSITVDNFVGNGVATTFALSVTPENIAQTIVNYNGIMQLRAAYSLTGNTIIFSEAPISGDYLEVTTTLGVTINSGTYVNRTYTGDGSTTMFAITAGATASSLIVSENGLMQRPTTDYTTSGSSLTFITAPSSGVIIQIRELGVFVVNPSSESLSPFLLMGA